MTCGYCAIVKSTVTRHCRHEHGIESPNDKDVNQVNALQTRQKGYKCRYFPVALTELNQQLPCTLSKNVDIKSLVETEMRVLDDSYTGLTVDENMNTDVFILEWNELFPLEFRRRYRELVQQTGKHDDWDYIKIKNTVTTYMETIQQLITSSSRLIRLMICRSDEDDEEYSNVRGFRRLESDESVQKYTQMAVLFVAFVLRVGSLNEDIFRTTNRVSSLASMFVESPCVGTLHDLLLAVVTTEYPTSMNERDILIKQFLVLFSCDRNGKFKSPQYLTSPFAMLKFLLRGIFLYDIRICGGDELQLKKFLRLGVNTTYNCLCQEMQLLYHLAKGSGTPESIYWVDTATFKELNVKGVRMRIDDLSTAYKRMNLMLNIKLSRELLLGLDVDRLIDNTKIKDDFSNCSLGYSFINDKSNNLLQLRTLLVEHIINTETLAKRFIDSKTDNNIQWNQVEIANWIKSCDEFMKYLMTTIHLCSGMPARAPEIAFTTINNTVSCDRSLYLYHRDIMLVQVQSSQSVY